MTPSYQHTTTNNPKEEPSYTPVPMIKKVAIAAMVGTALLVVGYSYGASTNPARIEIATTTTAAAANLVRGGVSTGDNSFADMEKEEGCWNGPCNKQRNEKACLSGTFAVGCNWYPQWGCSSCSGVSCGNHRAVECGWCTMFGGSFPANKGKNYCNGECKWHNVNWYVTAVTGKTSFCEPK